jgi:hypothetical protein
MSRIDFSQICEVTPVCGECRHYVGGVCIQHLVDVFPVHVACICFDNSAIQIPPPIIDECALCGHRASL